MITRDDDGRRVRPSAGDRLTGMPAKSTLAQVFCHRTKHRPRLLAVVLGSPKDVDGARVSTTEALPSPSVRVEQDHLIDCRCGQGDHDIDGRKLRLRLLAEVQDRRLRKPLRIDVASVSK